MGGGLGAASIWHWGWLKVRDDLLKLREKRWVRQIKVVKRLENTSLGLMWPVNRGERRAVLERKDIVWREGKKILFTVLFSEDTSRAKWQFSVLVRRKLELICGIRWWDTLLCWEKDGPISAEGTAVMIHWSSVSTQGRSKMMPRFQSWEKLKYSPRHWSASNTDCSSGAD